MGLSHYESCERIPKLLMMNRITGTSSFIDEFNFVDPRHLKAKPNLELDTTAYWMPEWVGISPFFFFLAVSICQNLT